MTFNRTKPLGWDPYEVLRSVQMNDIDAKTSHAIDGWGGGTYNPSAGIAINASAIPGGGIGIEGIGGGAGAGVRGTGGATASGGIFYGGSTSGHGVRGEARGEDNNGGHFLGKGFAAGCYATGEHINSVSNAGPGVLGMGGNNSGIGSGGKGIHGQGGNATGGGMGGPGVEGVGGASDGIGVLGLGAPSGNGIGVKGQGTGDCAGVRGESGATGLCGVEGISNSASGHGVYGKAGENENASGSGVTGYASGASQNTAGVIGTSVNGIGVRGVSFNNVAVVAETSSESHAALKIAPRGSDPNNPSDGEIWVTNSGQLKFRANGVTYTVTAT